MSDPPTWQMRWTREGRRSLKNLPPRITPAVMNFVDERLAVSPLRATHALHEPLESYRSASLSSYRILVQIDPTASTVYVVKVAYHADVYRPM